MPKFTKYDLVAIEERYRKGERLSASQGKLLNIVWTARAAAKKEE